MNSNQLRTKVIALDPNGYMVRVKIIDGHVWKIKVGSRILFCDNLKQVKQLLEVVANCKANYCDYDYIESDGEVWFVR